MPQNTSYVVGFLGRRDSQQIPLALAEAELLECFVTGISNHGWKAKLLGRISSRWNAALARRSVPGIPENRVDSRWWIELLQNLSSLAGDASQRSWVWADQAISRAARDVAQRTCGNLFLYEPYAWEAFTASYSHQPKRVLFHFHLHPRFERRLMEEDLNHHSPGEIPWSVIDALPRNDARVVDAWRRADLVVCASSFTKQSLVAEGMPPERCIVVPYGIDSPGDTQVEAPPGTFSALFVGSGIQRKGLHHLLRAWAEADLPPGSTLTVVCRSIDPALKPLLSKMPDHVRLLHGVTPEELTRLFRESSLFVMPSFAEGFGQVFLEALSLGCPVLGTPNTCLPDLGDEKDGIFVTETGNIPKLRARLEHLAVFLTDPQSAELRKRAAKLSEQFTWANFRRRLVEALTTIPAAP